MNVNNRIVDPDNWDEVGPLLGDYPLRPYKVLAADHYSPAPGFYENGEVLAFVPGWGGINGDDAVYWGPSRPTVAEVRDGIASRLVSSWLVQDRDDAGEFHLGNGGSIEAPWGIIPADVLFALRRGAVEDDEPWENLSSILDDVDKALANGASPADGFVGWRLTHTVPARVKTEFYRNPDGALVVTFRIRGNEHDVILFMWNPDGSPLRGEVQEFEREGVVGLYDAYPLPTEADLEAFLAQVDIF